MMKKMFVMALAAACLLGASTALNAQERLPKGTG